MAKNTVTEGVDFISKVNENYHTPFAFDVDGGMLFDSKLLQPAYNVIGAKFDYQKALQETSESLRQQIMELVCEFQKLLSQKYNRPNNTIRNGEFRWGEQNTLIVEFENNEMRKLKINRVDDNPRINLNNSLEETVIKIYTREVENGMLTNKVLCSIGSIPLYPQILDEDYKTTAVNFVYLLKAILRVLRLRAKMEEKEKSLAKNVGTNIKDVLR